MKAMRVLAILFVLIICCLLILAPAMFIDSARSGLYLFALNVLPSLFPFFVLTSLLGKLNGFEFLSKPLKKLFKSLRLPDETSGLFLISVISGYPVGARSLCDRVKNGSISLREAKAILPLCSTSGAFFIIGTCGTSLFCNTDVGIFLYVTHVISAVLCAVLTVLLSFFSSKTLVSSQNQSFLYSNFATNRRSSTNKAIENTGILTDSLYESIKSILVVGGYVTVFYVLADMLVFSGAVNAITSTINNVDIKNFIGATVCGLLEMTRGVHDLSQIGINRLSVAIAGGLLAFGGLSIDMQSIAFLSQIKMRLGYFFSVKLLQALISFFITFTVFPLIY